VIIINFITILAEKLIHLIDSLGYIGVFAVTTLEYACFPGMPSEVILPFIGVTTAQGKMTFIGSLVWSVIGGLTGSLICYVLGYYGEMILIERIEKRFPKTKGSVDTVNKWFAKYGKVAVLLSRLIPLTRTFISFVAGATRLDLFTFIAYSLAGILTWNTVLISLGYFVGDNLEYIHAIMSRFSAIVGVVFILIICLLLYAKKYRKSEKNQISKNEM